jgi:subtilisin family serine protease
MVERRRGRTGAIEQQLTTTVRGDADVLHFVPNEVVSIPESSGSAQLNQSTVVILDSVSNTTSYFGAPVPIQYVSQPAAGKIRLAEAQQLAFGTGVVVAVIDTGIDPHHPALAGSLVRYDFTATRQETPRSGWTSISRRSSSSIRPRRPRWIPLSCRRRLATGRWWRD